MNRRRLLLTMGGALTLTDPRTLLGQSTIMRPRPGTSVNRTEQGKHTIVTQTVMIPNTNTITFFYMGIAPLFPPRFRRPMRQVLIESGVLDLSDPEAVHSRFELNKTSALKDEFLRRVCITDELGTHKVTAPFLIGVNGVRLGGIESCIGLSGVAPNDTVNLVIADGMTGVYQFVPARLRI